MLKAFFWLLGLEVWDLGFRISGLGIWGVRALSFEGLASLSRGCEDYMRIHSNLYTDEVCGLGFGI